MAKIEFIGVVELEKTLESMADVSAIKTAVKKNGADLQRTMQRKADFKMGYQTGTTKRSIGLDITDGGMTAEVGPSTEYSPYLEWGTRFMAAQPFVWPAFNEVCPKFVSDIAKVIGGK